MAVDDANAAVERLRAEVAALREQNRGLTAAYAEARVQQAATAEILRVIASSPTDATQILQSIATTAAEICDAAIGMVSRIDDAFRCRVIAHHGPMPRAVIDLLHRDWITRDRGSVAGRVALDRVPVQIEDVLADPEYRLAEHQRLAGYRTIMAAPMLRNDHLLGIVTVFRTEVRPFTEQQIALLEAFADQAVIAIENARLFEALEQRTNELTLALEQQTATSEVLRVIASSPTDAQPVLDAVVQSALQLSNSLHGLLWLREGDAMRVTVAVDAPVPTGQTIVTSPVGVVAPVVPETLAGRVLLDRRTIHVPDRSDPAFAVEFPRSGYRTSIASLLVPLVREGDGIGVLALEPEAARPFTASEVALLETFADQAVIAIETARLFQELQESTRQVSTALERQTALAEVLRVIASSPADLQQVLEALVASAAQLCGADNAGVQRLDGDETVTIASTNPERLGARQPVAGTISGRVLLEARTVHLHGSPEEQLAQFPESVGARAGLGAQLITPLLRSGQPIGALILIRHERRPFTEAEIALLETFADQAVIAIENARLFEALNDRVGELQALGEVAQAVSSSLDLQEVLNTIVAHAVDLAGTDGGGIFEFEETDDKLHLRATRLYDEELIAALQTRPFNLGEGAVGRAAAERRPVQIEDIFVEGAYESGVRQVMEAAGHRALLALPLLREDRLLGGLVVSRKTPGAFSDEIVALLQTFATQSVRRSITPGSTSSSTCRGRRSPRRPGTSRSSWPT